MVNRNIVYRDSLNVNPSEKYIYLNEVIKTRENMVDSNRQVMVLCS